ncbi:MAG: TerC family protein [Actinomycetes bacterium]
MEIQTWMWLATMGGLLAIILTDLLIIGRRPHEPTLKEATTWVVLYVMLAVVFGLVILLTSGGQYAGEFFAGWLTEYSLSVDNLFVFVIIMGTFAVPREIQQTVLLVGILIALVMRGIFIAVGAAAIAAFSWIFYVFGVFLLYTAYKIATGKDTEGYTENVALRLARRVLPTTEEYDGAKVVTRVNGRRLFTPMLIVMVAIGTTDLLFALDSIPAIFGLTQEPYLVFTANAFALMGLRQLYFLLGGLLDRLVYLSYGLAFVLGFIGVKLILEAAHENGFGWAPTVPIWASLSVIVGSLAVTTLVSLAKVRRDRKRAAHAAHVPSQPGKSIGVPDDSPGPSVDR